MVGKKLEEKGMQTSTETDKGQIMRIGKKSEVDWGITDRKKIRCLC